MGLYKLPLRYPGPRPFNPHRGSMPFSNRTSGNIRMESFKQNDWYAFSAAEPWEDGTQPFISYGELHVVEWPDGPDFTDERIIVVADRRGICITGGNAWAILHLNCTPDLIRIIAESIPNPVNLTQLRLLGFRFSGASPRIDSLNFELPSLYGVQKA